MAEQIVRLQKRSAADTADRLTTALIEAADSGKPITGAEIAIVRQFAEEAGVERGRREAIAALRDKDALIQFSWKRRGEDVFVDLAAIGLAAEFLESRLSATTPGEDTDGN